MSLPDNFARWLDPQRTLWEDTDGVPHFDVGRVMEEWGLEDTRDNRRQISRLLSDILKEHGITAIHTSKRLCDGDSQN